jgi:hypothetical protein
MFLIRRTPALLESSSRREVAAGAVAAVAAAEAAGVAEAAADAEGVAAACPGERAASARHMLRDA